MSEQHRQRPLVQCEQEVAVLQMQLQAVHFALERQSSAVGAGGTLVGTEASREQLVNRAVITQLRRSRLGKWLLSWLLRRLLKPQQSSLKLVQQSAFFNAEWYLEHYPEVRGLGLPAACHFVLFGGLAGYDPGPEFSSSCYLSNYPDVVQSKMNPLVHYLRFGRTEGRTIQASQQKIRTTQATS